MPNNISAFIMKESIQFGANTMKNKRQILNIVNFIRGYDSEPQPADETYRTVLEQIKLIEHYHFKATFLIQYDALLFPEYRKLMPLLDKERYEIGVWFEINRPLAEDCGIRWAGQREWDGRVCCGYPMGYSKADRAKMVDKLFETFHALLGYYPRVFGAWFFDTFTVRYICDKYGLDALCNCKEQYGTDGYTLWGGYYGQAYYPSRTNVFMPAQSKANQLPAPLFRMLGADPVYQYDCGMQSDGSPRASQPVITLEPVYKKAGGGLPEWVDWYLKENFNGECLSFGYAQAGQENSFGWNAMKDGLIDQFEKFSELQKQNIIEIETLGESGRWFKRTYGETPAAAITAHSAYDDVQKCSCWFCSKQYRINLYGENGRFWIRDLHLFDDQLNDPFANAICTENAAVYESLPLVDGFLFSGGGVRAGAYLTGQTGENTPRSVNMIFNEKTSCCAQVQFVLQNGDSVVFTLKENSVEIKAQNDFILESKIAKADKLGTRAVFLPQVRLCTPKEIVLSHHDRQYSVILECGKFINAKKILSQDGKIKAQFAHMP